MRVPNWLYNWGRLCLYVPVAFVLFLLVIYPPAVPFVGAVWVIALITVLLETVCAIIQKRRAFDWWRK